MAGERRVVSIAERSGGQESGHATAARGIGLLHVDRTRREHPGGHRRGCRRTRRPRRPCRSARAATHSGEAIEVVARDRLLEPGDVELGCPLRHRQRLARHEGPVGIDEQGSLPDRLSGDPHPVRVAVGIGADLHLHEAAALVVHPAAELVAQLLVRVGREAARAVDRDRAPQPAEEASRAAGRGAFALRSHSARSTAETAVAASPDRPMLRTAACMARVAAWTSSASQSARTGASMRPIRSALDASA